MMLVKSMQHLQPNSILQGGKYRIERVLGQGGFGITYLAIQSGLERKVAIKEFFMKDLCERDEITNHVALGTEGSRDTVSRFRDKFIKEAKNIAKLNHPNIVSVIDIYEENGTAYYVMDYAEGGSLADRVNKEGFLPEYVATRYIKQIAEALGYIHNLKMNHLDVKPSNIMLNNDDNAILIDFGLSKQYDVTTGNQTSTTPVGISHGYAPMEQYKEGGVVEFSPETDIYALGATFYKLLTGSTPPSASDIMEDGLPVEELVSKRVSQSVINMICKAMEFRKKARLRNVHLFISGLENPNCDIETKVDGISFNKGEDSIDETTTFIESAGQKTPNDWVDTDTDINKYSSSNDNIHKSFSPDLNTNNTSTNSFIKKSNKSKIWYTIFTILFCMLFFMFIGKQLFFSETENVEYVSKGVFEDKNGISFTYTGNVLNGRPDGKGTGYYPYGVYTGEYKNGLRQGRGKFESKDGSNKYDGTFDNDSYLEGTLKSSGMTYKGTFYNEQPYNGTWYDSNNGVYADIKDGKIEEIPCPVAE